MGLKDKAEQGDYVILMTEGEKPKPQLWKVLAVSDSGKLNVRLEKDPHLSNQRTSVPQELVKVNLGPKPPEGKVYGYNVSAIYRRSVPLLEGTRDLTLYVFGRPQKSDIATIAKAFTYTNKVFTKAGIEGVFQEEVAYELGPLTGKYSGMFTASKDTDKAPHRLWLSYSHLKKVPSSEYVVLHEMGHLINYSMRDYSKLWSRWLALYVETVMPVRVNVKECSALLKALTSFAHESEEKSHCRSWVKSLDEDTKPKSNAVLRWLATHRHITVASLDLLLKTDRADLVTSLWPNHSIDTKTDLKPMVSEYACKSVNELIAEAVAYHFTARKLPKSVTRLLEDTLTLARTHYKKRLSSK